jgi:F-type H+-transporting ATPase subunit b
LREEAQRVLADYQRKRQEAEAEAEAIVTSAVASKPKEWRRDATTKLQDFVVRRTKMAEAKIAQARAQATADVRAAAADAAIRASELILRQATPALTPVWSRPGSSRFAPS